MIGRLTRWTGGADGDRVSALERLVRKLDENQRERTSAVDARLARLTDAVTEGPTAKDLRELRQAVRALTPRDDRQLLDELARVATSGRPIVIGPWTGELGFELLYWIPFVDWVRRQWNVPPESEVVISRGGVASWYRTDTARYTDIFSLTTPAQFKAAVAGEKRKQRRVGALDEQLIAEVASARALTDYEVLHPRFMFRLFAPFWSDDAGYARIDQFTRYRRLDTADQVSLSGLPDEAFLSGPPDKVSLSGPPDEVSLSGPPDKASLSGPPDEVSLSGPPDEAALSGLPDEYVAVRFYFSECFPDTPENRAFAQAAVASLAEHTAVVLLNPGFSVDEHEDWASAASGNAAEAIRRVHTIADGLRPERNLAVQGAVISRARAFVGTYGGYSYLAPLYGVPAVAFYSRPTFKRHHLYAAQRAFDQTGAAALTLVDTTQAAVVQSTIGAVAGTHS